MKLKRLLPLLVLLITAVPGAWAQEQSEQQSGEAQTTGQQQTGGETQPVSPDQPYNPEQQEEKEATVTIVTALLNDIKNENVTGVEDVAIIVIGDLRAVNADITLAEKTQKNVGHTKDNLQALKTGLEANNTAVSSASTITGNLDAVNELVEVNPDGANSEDPEVFEISHSDGSKTKLRCINGFDASAATFNAQMKLAEQEYQNAQSATSSTDAVNYAVLVKSYLGNAATALTAANNLITSAETVISTARTDLTNANSALSNSNLVNMQGSLSLAKNYAQDAKNAAVAVKNYISGIDNQSLVTDVDLAVSKTADLYNKIARLKVSSAPGVTALEAVGQKITGLEGNVSLARQCLAMMQGRYNTLKTALTATGLLPQEPDPTELKESSDDPLAVLTEQSGQTVDVKFTRSFTAGVSSTICLPFAITSAKASDGLTDGGKLYTFNGVDDKWQVHMTSHMADANNLQAVPTTANTPYLFIPSVTGDVTFSGTIANVAASYTPTEVTQGNWKFTGTYNFILWDEESDFTGATFVYAFVAKPLNPGSTIQPGEFIRLYPDGSTTKPFRAVMKYTGALTARGIQSTAKSAVPTTLKVVIDNANGTTTEIGSIDTRTDEITTGDWYSLDGCRLAGKPSKKGLYINNGRKVAIK